MNFMLHIYYVFFAGITIESDDATIDLNGKHY